MLAILYGITGRDGSYKTRMDFIVSHSFECSVTNGSNADTAWALLTARSPKRGVQLF